LKKGDLEFHKIELSLQKYKRILLHEKALAVETVGSEVDFSNNRRMSLPPGFYKQRSEDRASIIVSYGGVRFKVTQKGK